MDRTVTWSQKQSEITVPQKHVMSHCQLECGPWIEKICIWTRLWLLCKPDFQRQDSSWLIEMILCGLMKIRIKWTMCASHKFGCCSILNCNVCITWHNSMPLWNNVNKIHLCGLLIYFIWNYVINMEILHLCYHQITSFYQLHVNKIHVIYGLHIDLLIQITLICNY
jgi:hypothetical protein